MEESSLTWYCSRKSGPKPEGGGWVGREQRRKGVEAKEIYHKIFGKVLKIKPKFVDEI